MRKGKIFCIITAVSVMMAASMTAMAMPADIEEAVTQDGYNAYAYGNGSASDPYADTDLIQINGDYVATADAMIRTAPFGEILGSVIPGHVYHVVGEAPDCMWYKISGAVTGYVYASYMVPQNEYNTATNGNTDLGVNVRSLDIKMTVNARDGLNVRTEPNTWCTVLKTLPNGTEVHVTGKVLGTEWYQCKVDGQTVYMNDNYLQPELPQYMVCTADAGLNVRTGAGTDYPIIAVLRKGDKVKISDDENDWLKFSLENGTIGYVYSEYMAVIDQ